MANLTVVVIDSFTAGSKGIAAIEAESRGKSGNVDTGRRVSGRAFVWMAGGGPTPTSLLTPLLRLEESLFNQFPSVL